MKKLLTKIFVFSPNFGMQIWSKIFGSKGPFWNHLLPDDCHKVTKCLIPPFFKCLVLMLKPLLMLWICDRLLAKCLKFMGKKDLWKFDDVLISKSHKYVKIGWFHSTENFCLSSRNFPKTRWLWVHWSSYALAVFDSAITEALFGPLLFSR